MEKITVLSVIVIMVIGGLFNYVAAAENANYSGRYLLERPKKASADSTDSSLEVIQKPDMIEITLSASGTLTTKKCPFDGTEGDYKSQGVLLGKCKAQLKVKELIIESLYMSSNNFRVYNKQRWQLSKDGKILKIKSDVSFPDFSFDVNSIMSNYTSNTARYIRVENP